jgi:hypothetical protein
MTSLTLAVPILLMTIVLSIYSWQVVRRADKFVVTAWFQIAYLWYSFLIIPVAHVYFDYLPFAVRSYDVPSIFANLIVLNAIGLVFANLGFALVRDVRLPTIEYDQNRLMMVSGGFVVVGVVAWVFALNPGMLYVDDAFHRDESISVTLYIFSGAVPMLIVIASVAYFRNRPFMNVHKWSLFIILVILAVILGGMRGNRSSMIIIVSSGLIWIHLFLRPFTWRELAAIGISGFLFILAYGRYKYGGLGAVLGTDPKGIEHANSMLDPLRIFLLDLGRAEVQAMVLDNFRQGHFVPRYNGETYIRAFTQILFESWEPDWLRPKTVVGPLAQYVAGSTRFATSRIYGLTGEAILNFGYLAIPAVFFLYGLVHAFLLAALKRMDGALVFLAPLSIMLPVVLLFVDLDNLVVFFIVYWALPIFVVATSLRRGTPLRAAETAGRSLSGPILSGDRSRPS